MSLETAVAQGAATNFFLWGFDKIWYGARIVIPKTTSAIIVTSVASGALSAAGLIYVGSNPPDLSEPGPNNRFYKILAITDLVVHLALLVEGGFSTSLGGLGTALVVHRVIEGTVALYQHLQTKSFDPQTKMD